MDEGWGMLQRGVDQYCSHTVGTGHLQSLISREEKLEKEATKRAIVTEGPYSIRHKGGARGKLQIRDWGLYEEQRVGNRTKEHNGIKEH